MPCKHAALALIYAQQMAEMDEPWKLWEARGCEEFGWLRFNSHFIFDDRFEYRQIPKTIQIGAFSVPEPMREKPDYCGQYWYVNTNDADGATVAGWTDAAVDRVRLRRGMCHATRENCIIHAKALFSFSEIKEI